MDVLKGFSERLSELMQENGLNAESLGKAINIAPPVIRRWCLPYKDAYYKNVVRVADYFNCSLDFLCGRSDIVLDFVPKECPPFAVLPGAVDPHIALAVCGASVF